MEIPLPVWFLQGIPECLGSAAFVFSLGTGQLYWKPVFSVGLIQAVLAYTIRLLPITPGVHVLVLVASLAILSHGIGRIGLKKSLVYSVFAVVIIIVCETVGLSLLNIALGVEWEDFVKNLRLRIFIGQIQVLVLFIMAVFFWKRPLKRRYLTHNR